MGWEADCSCIGRREGKEAEVLFLGVGFGSRVAVQFLSVVHSSARVARRSNKWHMAAACMTCGSNNRAFFNDEGKHGNFAGCAAKQRIRMSRWVCG